MMGKNLARLAFFSMLVVCYLDMAISAFRRVKWEGP